MEIEIKIRKEISLQNLIVRKSPQLNKISLKTMSRIKLEYPKHYLTNYIKEL